ncbi:hypothetical protein DUNSADRAFT_18219 [Dunaliella salina]|uniref:F-box domain-containing protein n=1 Tax=Dunaliella salina TaxID=3046 RepID=A0ABQ7GZB8_DUNSA|nr:hypothetical protein DUNSADRAFT_18219 [Dunaliella salina]|eukprot:KAF5839938.1 hypothetical protein DUNSADRAFT_18219 [Dunaliella salina]
MASLQSLPQELVGHIFAMLPDKDARQSFFATSPIVSRASSVVDQIKAITLAGSWLSQSGGNPLDTVPEGASLRDLTLIFDSPPTSHHLASCVTSTLHARPGLVDGLAKINIIGLEARDLPMLGTVARQCRNSLRTINIVTAGNGGVFDPSTLPWNLVDSFAQLRGLIELHLMMGRSDTGDIWSDMASNCLVEALAVCETIRSLTLSDLRPWYRRAKWMPELVYSLPHLEYLALGGDESRCNMLYFTSWANVGQLADAQASVGSLHIGEIGAYELTGFLFSMFGTTHDRFPSLRSLEIKVLHDRDYEEEYGDIVDVTDGLASWHGRAGNLSISVSDGLDVTEWWLLFFMDKGFRLDTVQSMALTMSNVLEPEDTLGMTTEFDERRARLLAESLPNLQGLSLIHPAIKDHQSFLAGCMALAQNLQSLKRLDIEHRCHSEYELKLLGQMAYALRISAALVERTDALSINLLLGNIGAFSLSQTARGELQHVVDLCFGAHMLTSQTASMVHFRVS